MLCLSCDTDYLLDNACNFESQSPLINSHDESLEWYKKLKNELIYNPNNYFYFNDIKFVSFPYAVSNAVKSGKVFNVVGIEVQ